MYIEENKLMSDDGFILNPHDYLGTKKYIKRYYDYNTKNISFKNVCRILKALGVKNNNEHLQIFDESLIGVDPHSPNLSGKVKSKIEKEIRRNIWYYLREVVRVPAGNKLNYFELNIGSFTTAFLITRRQNFFYEISRQVGKTYLLTTLLGWVINFGGRRISMRNIHHKAESAIDNLNKIKDSMNIIPDWLQYHNYEYFGEDKKTGKKKIRRQLLKSANSTSIENKLFKNTISNVVVGGTLDSADKAGRGASAHIYLIDEVSFIKNNKVAFGSLNNSTSTKRNEARRLGYLHGIWMLGTPGNLATPHGRWVLDKIKKEYIRFSIEQSFLFDYTNDEIDEYVNNTSISNFWHVTYDWRELGFNEKWFFEKNRNEDPHSIRRETLLFWEEELRENPFTKAEIGAMEMAQRSINPVQFKLDDNNTFIMYPKKGEIHDTLSNFLSFNFRDGIVMGVDIANGMGNDYSTITMVDAKTLRIIATYKNNTIDTDDFALLLVYLLEDIIAANDLKCCVQIERNMPGVIMKLKKYNHLQKYLMVYPTSEVIVNGVTKPVDFTTTESDGRRVSYKFGLQVTGTIRDEMVNTLLFTLVRKHTEVFSVPEIVNEVKGLTKKKVLNKYRIDHAPDSHDDTIFSALHAYYPIYYASEILKKRFRITITPSEWIISNGIRILPDSTRDAGIVKRYSTDRLGRLLIKFYDSKTGEEVNPNNINEINKLNIKDRDYIGLSRDGQKEIKDRIKIKEEIEVFNNNDEIKNYINIDKSKGVEDILLPIEKQVYANYLNRNGKSDLSSIYRNNTLRRR